MNDLETSPIASSATQSPFLDEESGEFQDSEEESSGEEEEGGICAVQDHPLRDNPTIAVQEHWYETTVRLRMAFYTFNALSLLLGVTMGFIVNIFFEVLGSTEVNKALVFSIQCMPMALLWHAVMVDEMLDIGLDGMDMPALGIFRATITTFLHQWAPGITTWFSEVLALFCIEGLPLIMTLCHLLTGGHVARTVNAYLLGGLLGVVILTFVYVIAHVFVDSNATAEAQMVELYPRVKHFGKLVPQKIILELSRYDTINMKRRFMKAIGFLVCSVVVNLVSVTLHRIFSGKVGLMVACELLIVVLGYLAIRAVAPRLLGKAFFFTFGIFIFLVVLLWFGATDSQEKPPKAGLPPLCRGPLTQGYGHDDKGLDLPLHFRPPLNAQGYGYPVCSGLWGNRDMSIDNQFGILDLGALAFVSSYPYEEDIRDNLGKMFNGTKLDEWRIVEVEPPETIGRWVIIDFPKQQTRVIAVRGTSNLLDVYADLEIYAKVSIFQVMSKLTPLLNFLGDSPVRNMVSSTLPSRFFDTPNFWDRFMQRVALRKEEALLKNYSVVLTGHSLGGALAGAASAKNAIQGVGFSAPGLFYQTMRMGISTEDLQYTFTEIQPSGDVVPRADVQIGAVNWIKCEKSPGTCHRLTHTTCELWRRCGDPRDRDWRETCGGFYVASDLNTPAMNTHFDLATRPKTEI